FAEVLQQERAAGHSSQSPSVQLPRRDLQPPTLGEVVGAIHLENRADLAEASAALCFSGGGIRSATFGLGVLQALARSGLLPRFDYLSPVSGGGSLGSWLSGWTYREKSTENVFAELAGSCGKSIESPEPPQVSHLRRFSNYLSPR